MNIEPRVPIKTDDASRGRRSPKAFLVNSLLVTTFFSVLYFSLGWIAIALVHLVPLHWQAKLDLGDAFLSQRQVTVPDGVTRIFERVASTADLGIELKLYVIDVPFANAFALPGGHILLTRPLLENAASEEELAFVIAHEIGHFRERHLLERLSRRAIYGIAFAMVLNQSDISGFLLKLEDMNELRFSRSQELEADAYGLDLLVNTYGHAGGATHFFEKPESGLTMPSFLETHPQPEARIEAIMARIDKKGFPVEATTEKNW